MMTNSIGSRHIHLDFHTSEKIEGVCAQFNPEEFAKTLKNASVNSVTLFSCCHHGMLYYDSELYPELVHPNLIHRDLLKEQAAACHQLGIQVNLYTTIRWNKIIADHHPEWICIDENGKLQDYKGKGLFEAGFYKNLCINTPYRKFLKKQFGEVLATIPAEGVWYDAAFMNECCCSTCQKIMCEKGLDPTKKTDRELFARITYYDMVEDLTTFAKAFNPNFNVCYNKGHVGYLDKPAFKDYSYFAFESLPGADWGYLDFPISAKYMRQFGKECFGLTSRFHTEWGDFHAFRNQAAMEYEVFSMLANGCKCIIGDQMDYWGQLNPYMYKQIGKVFQSVAEKEPWCLESSSIPEIGVFTAEEFFATGVAGHIPGASEGVCRLLMELGYQFDFIDSQSDFLRYKLVILPDVIKTDESFAKKLEFYCASGGKIIASYHSGLSPEEKQFNLKCLGVYYKGEAPFSPDFIIPQGHLVNHLPPTEHVMYSQGTLVETCEKVIFVQMATRPVFNRSYEHFCSHLHSPSAREVCYPAIIESDCSTYFIHPVFTQYQNSAPPWYKKLITIEIERLIGKPLVTHNGPSSVQVNLLEQQNYDRQILHVLHYIPQRKCKFLDIVDETIPLLNLSIHIRSNRNVKSIYLVPEKKFIEFNQNEKGVHFCMPEINGHQMVSINFK